MHFSALASTAYVLVFGRYAYADIAHKCGFGPSHEISVEFVAVFSVPNPYVLSVT